MAAVPLTADRELTALQFLIDIDGTLYDGDRPIEGASAAIEFLQARDIPFLLVTNTTRMNKDDIVRRLLEHAITVGPDRVFAVPEAACTYLAGNGPGEAAS